MAHETSTSRAGMVTESPAKCAQKITPISKSELSSLAIIVGKQARQAFLSMTLCMLGYYLLN